MILLLLQVLGAMPDAAHLTRRADSAAVPALAVLSVAYQESRSNLNPLLRGQQGEAGRFQILAATGRRRCPGLMVRTRYEDNVTCFLKMFAEDAARHGVARAVCMHNTGRPLETCPFSDEVLARWKREELLREAGGEPRKPKGATRAGPNNYGAPAPTDGTYAEGR